jgi:hypothetical protein
MSKTIKNSMGVRNQKPAMRTGERRAAKRNWTSEEYYSEYDTDEEYRG